MNACPHDFVIRVCNWRSALLICTLCQGTAVLVTCRADPARWHRLHPDAGAAPGEMLGTAITPGTWLLP